MNIQDIRDAADKVTDAQRQLRTTIRSAIDSGVTVASAARAAGVSTPTIYKWMRLVANNR